MDIDHRQTLFASCFLGVGALLAIGLIFIIPAGTPILISLLFFLVILLLSLGCHCLDRREKRRCDGYRRSL
ncbi:MAG: hypothetical protein JO053_02030 [Acidobacteria bacterium]|nr:hypothetical protein [Acidobacteriota bacterium]